MKFIIMLLNINLDIGTKVDVAKYLELVKNIRIFSWHCVIFEFVKKYFGQVVKEYSYDVDGIC
jgi:hypothetical protein